MSMNNTITYLNTDLCLISNRDLSELAEHFGTHDVCNMFPIKPEEDGLWYVSFETSSNYRESQGDDGEPELDITLMLTAVESLPTRLRSIWDNCSQREFNIGYDCSEKPWAFNQGLSNEVLRRLAVVGGTLRWTIYPDRE